MTLKKAFFQTSEHFKRILNSLTIIMGPSDFFDVFIKVSSLTFVGPSYLVEKKKEREVESFIH